jgi:hypothetical protein
VLAAVFAAQLKKRENYSDFPAGFRNPNKRREQLEKSTMPHPRFSGVSLLAKFQPVYTWADVLQCMSTSPKDFMPAGIGEKKPKDIKVFDIGDQGQRRRRSTRRPTLRRWRPLGGRKRAAFAAPVVAALSVIAFRISQRRRKRLVLLITDCRLPNRWSRTPRRRSSRHRCFGRRKCSARETDCSSKSKKPFESSAAGFLLLLVEIRKRSVRRS